MFRRVAAADLLLRGRAFSNLRSLRVSLRASMWSPAVFRVIPPRDVALFALGCFVGMRLKLFCWVEGRSMLPTLRPGELMLRINCSDPASPLGLVALLKGWRGAGSAAEALLGRVVVFRVKSDGTLICKRVGSPALEELEPAYSDDIDGNGASFEPVEGAVSLDLQPIAPQAVEAGDRAVFGNDAAVGNDEAAFASQREAFEARMIAELDELTTRASRRHYTAETEWRWCFEQVRLSGEFVWLQGDNPPESLDSRAVGGLPIECFRGIPIAVVWPLSSARLIR